MLNFTETRTDRQMEGHSKQKTQIFSANLHLIEVQNGMSLPLNQGSNPVCDRAL
jgi:hypothetical protein